jgi:hypothetical protein
MSENINPLNPLLGKIEKFEQSDQQIRQWESSRVEWTLRRLKFEAQRKEILSDSYDGRYTFEAFNRVASFPMELCGESLKDEPPIHRDPRAIHPLWFKAFVGLPFVRHYEERFTTFVEKNPERPLGMVFPRKGFSQGLILHNGDWDLFVPPQSSCHIFNVGKKHSMNLIVQPYMGFIDHVRKILV